MVARQAAKPPKDPSVFIVQHATFNIPSKFEIRNSTFNIRLPAELQVCRTGSRKTILHTIPLLNPAGTYPRTCLLKNAHISVVASMF